jgi:HEPN domain-containing protein
MHAPDPLIDLVREWLAKADNDLTNAVHTLKMGADCPTDTVCFHCQQCVEKCIKALLTYRSIHFPKSHDIHEVRGLLPPDCARSWTSRPNMG